VNGRRRRLILSGFPDDPRSGLVHVLGRLAGLVGLEDVLLKDFINGPPFSAAGIRKPSIA
jgi:hypothetical protein